VKQCIQIRNNNYDNRVALVTVLGYLTQFIDNPIMYENHFEDFKTKIPFFEIYDYILPDDKLLLPIATDVIKAISDWSKLVVVGRIISSHLVLKNVCDDLYKYIIENFEEETE